MRAPIPAFFLPRPVRSSSRSSARMRSRQPLSRSFARKSNSSRALSSKRGCSRALPLSVDEAGRARYWRRMAASCERNVPRWLCCQRAPSVRDQHRSAKTRQQARSRRETHDLVGLLQEGVLCSLRPRRVAGRLAAVDPAANRVDVDARLALMELAAAPRGWAWRWVLVGPRLEQVLEGRRRLDSHVRSCAVEDREGGGGEMAVLRLQAMARRRVHRARSGPPRPGPPDDHLAASALPLLASAPHWPPFLLAS
jgi:hypothetical protein